jgi:hypothetical protein
MTYAANIQITANTAWTTWHTASHHATEATEAAIAWYRETFFSPEASARYEEIGKILGFVMACTVACGMTARIIVQHWIDGQVAAAMVEDTTEGQPQEATTENPDQWLIDLADEAAAPTVVEFLEALTTPVLRRECSERGITWKNARGQNRHLTKAQMVAAIAAQYPQGPDGQLWPHAA